MSERFKSLRRQSSEMSGDKMSVRALIEIAVAEVVGTACLLFFGCMSLIGPSIPPLQPAIAFGLVVATIVQIFGHISGSHLNPTVTLCAVIMRKINAVSALVYVLSECLGAILGIGLLNLVTPCDLWMASAPNGSVCVTAPLPILHDGQSLAIEFSATFFLILVVCCVWDERNSDKLDSVPLKFGVVIALLAMVAGPYTGGSMNPARSLGPAFLTGNFHKHWVYWVGPLSGSAVASFFYKSIFLRKQALRPGVAEEVPLSRT
ncbi:aquaporin AQPAn.G isoform X2 [Nilaparvata lugens]|uniref:aquaporin AQPAn.G isoform X2 n=1 Tax=Nilaparvata lugens TaxID=108931 RepID=UPI00193DCE97|nr:aquaporin AQPAn.G isoform X2 [Nilaparvata lugens]